MTKETGTITATHLTYATAVTELLSNGDFETGELSPWTTLYATTIVATTYKSDLNGGDYGCYFECNAGDVGGITQTFSTTAESIHSISFDYISDIGVIVGLNGNDITIADATDTWTNFSTNGPFLYEEEPLTDITHCHLYTGRGNYVEIDNISFMGVITTDNVSSATIEDNSKTWTADQFNTDGTFILTSGDVKGYSCKVLDTFENYIQVPTTFANIINNIDSGTTYYPATNQPVNAYFETGDMTGWNTSLADEGEGRFATMYVQSSTVYSGSYSLCCNQSCEDSDYTISTFSTSLDITGAEHLTFYRKMPVCDGGAETKLKVQVGAWDDPNVVVVSYTDVTNNWIKESIDISALTGTQTIKFVIYTGDPS